MVHFELDELDIQIINLLFGKKYWPAKNVYSRISGFKHGKFGRTLILIRLIKLTQKGYLDMQMTPGSEEAGFKSLTKIRSPPI